MKILSMPAGAASTNYLYKDGVWNVGYENPGSYQWQSSTKSPFTLAADKMTSSTSVDSQIGTTNLIDVTNYNTLHVVAKGITAYGGSCAAFGVKTSKNFDVADMTGSITTVGSTVDYNIDVSSKTTVYFSILCPASRAVEITEIYLA